MTAAEDQGMDRGATSSSPCSGLAANCGRLSRLGEMHADFCERGGIAGEEAMLNAAAVGLVIDVWRDSPVEDMHAGRRGPSDAAMFAESTELHSAAVTALTSADRCDGLLGFEDHLLDRSRPWAGTGGRTLSDLGYGFLGHYRRHVKQQINVLMGLCRHTCDHPAWHQDYGHQALRTMPAAAGSASDLAAALLTRPAALPPEVLDWLSDHLLYCAGPPWGSAWESVTPE